MIISLLLSLVIETNAHSKGNVLAGQPKTQLGKIQRGNTQLGVAHIGGLYSFSNTDFLNEGAAMAETLGAKCIKVSLTLDTDNPSQRVYARNSLWPDVKTLDALADTSYFRSLFSRGFDTYILWAFRPGRSASYWREQFTNDDAKAEEECFASLTRYLLRTYKNTRKTFILQNWEGDWALRGSFDPGTKPTRAATEAMIKWLQARQRGVDRARSEFQSEGPKVFHACEVNLVRQSQTNGEPGVTTDVLPFIPIDLVSYSAWDTKNSPADFANALKFISRHKIRTEPFGDRAVFIGEFGLPESEATPEIVFNRTQSLFNEAIRFGCPFAIFWQLYCNEAVKKDPVVNGDYKGFWLIRPDGTRSLVCNLFAAQPEK